MFLRASLEKLDPAAFPYNEKTLENLLKPYANQLAQYQKSLSEPQKIEAFKALLNMRGEKDNDFDKTMCTTLELLYPEMATKLYLSQEDKNKLAILSQFYRAELSVVATGLPEFAKGKKISVDYAALALSKKILFPLLVDSIFTKERGLGDIMRRETKAGEILEAVDRCFSRILEDNPAKLFPDRTNKYAKIDGVVTPIQSIQVLDTPSSFELSFAGKPTLPLSSKEGQPHAPEKVEQVLEKMAAHSSGRILGALGLVSGRSNYLANLLKTKVQRPLSSLESPSPENKEKKNLGPFRHLL